MTAEVKYFLDVDDILAVQLECSACHVSSSFPLSKRTRAPHECPHCKIDWVFPDTSEDVWHIIPAVVALERGSICVRPGDKNNKYERYREAWHLLHDRFADAPKGPGSFLIFGSIEEPNADSDVKTGLGIQQFR